MTWHKKALAAYVALTLGVGGAFYYTHGAIDQIHRNSVASCVRNNTLRAIIHDIILAGNSQTEKLVTEGTITQAQATRALQFARDSANKLKPVNCVHAAAVK